MVMAESYPGFDVQIMGMEDCISYTLYNTVYRSEAVFVGNQMQVQFDFPPVIQRVGHLPLLMYTLQVVQQPHILSEYSVLISNIFIKALQWKEKLSGEKIILSLLSITQDNIIQKSFEINKGANQRYLFRSQQDVPAKPRLCPSDINQPQLIRNSIIV